MSATLGPRGPVFQHVCSAWCYQLLIVHKTVCYQITHRAPDLGGFFADSCEHSKEPSGFVKGGIILTREELFAYEEGLMCSMK
jgi:hypothetical protein